MGPAAKTFCAKLCSSVLLKATARQSMTQRWAIERRPQRTYNIIKLLSSKVMNSLLMCVLRVYAVDMYRPQTPRLIQDPSQPVDLSKNSCPRTSQSCKLRKFSRQSALPNQSPLLVRFTSASAPPVPTSPFAASPMQSLWGAHGA